MFDPSLLVTYGWLTFDVQASGLITNYCERAQERLIEQFETKPNIIAYLCALIESLQDLEFVFGDLLTLRTLENAAGVQLDGLGDIVGIDRQGLTDNAYRTAIRFQIGINFSNGEPETLIALTRFITEGTVVNYTELYPARVSLLTDGSTISAATIPIIEQSAPAGVKIELTSTFGSLVPFAFATEPGDVDPIPEGFAEPNFAPDAGLGGELSEKFI